MRRTFLLLLFGLAASLFLAACAIPGAESAREGAAEGEKAQDFTLKDLKDSSVSLSSFLGKKVLLVDFSTTWCPHCITIIPTLKNIHENYKDVEVIGVYINESKATVEKLAERYKIPYAVLLDSDGAVANDYGIRGVPTIILVDRDGIIRFKGHHVSLEVIEEIVKE